jgi:hypothetical protein
MGIMSNTVSIYQYRVEGKVPGNDRRLWVQQCLEKSRFEPIDTTPDAESTGWVRFDDHMSSEFGAYGTFSFEDYFIFSLRRDTRKVPLPW